MDRGRRRAIADVRWWKPRRDEWEINGLRFIDGESFRWQKINENLKFMIQQTNYRFRNNAGKWRQITPFHISHFSQARRGARLEIRPEWKSHRCRLLPPRLPPSTTRAQSAFNYSHSFPGLTPDFSLASLSYCHLPGNNLWIEMISNQFTKYSLRSARNSSGGSVKNYFKTRRGLARRADGKCSLRPLVILRSAFNFPVKKFREVDSPVPGGVSDVFDMYLRGII